MIDIINNFFTESEIDFLNQASAKGIWSFDAHSSWAASSENSKPTFWYKDIFLTKATDLFYEKIKRGTNRDIVVDRVYVNGQARGQSGWWHVDVPPPFLNHFTIVYFAQEWKPEYGGHLLIKTDSVISILPEYNKAVIFDSTLEHMGLEPTVYCNMQRESFACKFRVLDE